MDGYLKFDLIRRKPKTMVYLVESLKSGDSLGEIAWHGPWRRYVFSPYNDTIFDAACLGEIKNFVDKLMQEAKAAREVE